MSATAVSPEAPKKEFSWKRLFVTAAGFGAGAALMFCVLAGVGLWYMNRPKPPKPWNTKAITATFASAEFGGWDKDKVAGEFYYVLENHTDDDYRFPEKVIVMEQSKSSDSLVEFRQAYFQEKIFVPAHQKVKVLMVSPFDYSDGFTDRDLKNNDKIVNFLTIKLKDIKNLVVFDESNRFQIDLPSGWENMHR